MSSRKIVCLDREIQKNQMKIHRLKGGGVIATKPFQGRTQKQALVGHLIRPKNIYKIFFLDKSGDS